MRSSRILWVMVVLGAAALTVRAQSGSAPAAANNETQAPRIDMADFAKALAAADVVVLDVRSAQAYAAGHIPGALSYPLSDLAGKIEQLKPLRKPIVAYCS